MTTRRNYRDLAAWQKAMDLVEAIYGATREFPKEEMFGLTSQLRRAAVSVPSNIAEGQGRRSEKDFMRFLTLAFGSLMEVETQVLIAQRLGYIDPDGADDLMGMCGEVARIINGLHRKLAERCEP